MHGKSELVFSVGCISISGVLKSLIYVALLGAAEETKKCQESEGLSQFASLTRTQAQGLQKINSFG